MQYGISMRKLTEAQQKDQEASYGIRKRQSKGIHKSPDGRATLLPYRHAK